MQETPNAPKYSSLEDIFPVAPDNKGQAVRGIEMVWKSLSPEERKTLFSECNLQEADCQRGWNDSEFERQAFYEHVLYKLYGYHQPPYIPLSEQVRANEEKKLVEESRGWFSRLFR